MSRGVILAIIIVEGIGVWYFGGMLPADAWIAFWSFMALWSANETMMMNRRNNGS